MQIQKVFSNEQSQQNHLVLADHNIALIQSEEVKVEVSAVQDQDHDQDELPRDSKSFIELIL